MLDKKLLKAKLGLEPVSDLDNFNNKRIDLSGSMMATLFRDAFKQMQYRARVEVSTKYEFNHSEYSDENFMNIINENNFYEILEHTRKYLDGISKF